MTSCSSGTSDHTLPPSSPDIGFHRRWKTHSCSCQLKRKPESRPCHHPTVRAHASSRARPTPDETRSRLILPVLLLTLPYVGVRAFFKPEKDVRQSLSH
jgi:hypothetical protein